MKIVLIPTNDLPKGEVRFMGELTPAEHLRMGYLWRLFMEWLAFAHSAYMLRGGSQVKKRLRSALKRLKRAGVDTSTLPGTPAAFPAWFDRFKEDLREYLAAEQRVMALLSEPAAGTA